MKVLDLFCREGGAGYGYKQGGASLVVGVDKKRVRNYAGDLFIRANVFDLDEDFIRQFDHVHASPDCQGLTEMNNDKSKWENLIPATRKLLQRCKVSYTIENVRKARPHMIEPVSLFGTMFGDHMVTSEGRRYDLSRERLFETNWGLEAPLYDRPNAYPIANVIGGHLRCRDAAHRTGKGTGRTVDFPGEDRPALARQLMGMPWGTMAGMSDAIPPSYTRFIARQFIGRQFT